MLKIDQERKNLTVRGGLKTMPVLLLYRDMTTFPTGMETALLNLIASRIREKDSDIILPWSIADLGQDKESFPNIHLELGHSFRGFDPFTLFKMTEMIAAEIGYFANEYAPGVKIIEVCLTNKVDGRSYDVALRRQPKAPSDPKETWRFPIPDDFNA